MNPAFKKETQGSKVSPPRRIPKTFLTACKRAIYWLSDIITLISVASVSSVLRARLHPDCIHDQNNDSIHRKHALYCKMPVSNIVTGMEAEMIPWPGTEGWLSWRPDSVIALNTSWRTQPWERCYLMRAQSRWAVWSIKELGIIFLK